MPLKVISDIDGKLEILQTGTPSQDDPISSIEMVYSKWPVQITLNLMPTERVTITRVDTKEQDDKKKLKGRESPTHMMFNDVENFVDTIAMLKLKGISPEIIELLNSKFELAKSHRPASPRLTNM